MKKITSTFVILITLLCSFVQAEGNPVIELSGNSNTFLGNFQLKELGVTDMNGEQLKTFQLSYEKSKNPVMIYLDEKSNCRDYIVRAKNLEVKYTCKKNSFGVALLSPKQAKFPTDLNSRFLSQEAFDNQKVLADGSLPVEVALDLIANYFPDLIKYHELLN